MFKIKKIQLKTLASFFNFTTRAISIWKKEKRPVIVFLQKYFTDEDIEQFLEKGKIDRLDWLEDCKNVTDFIIKEVFDYCQDKRQEPEMQVFGKFLESIHDQRMEKTWVDFKEFLEKEEEIWEWLKQGFAQYLIKNECLDMLISCMTECIGNIRRPNYPNWNEHESILLDGKKFLVFSAYHRYYYIKHFMWMFAPNNKDQKTLPQINKDYDSLPSHFKAIPKIKNMIKTIKINILLGEDYGKHN